MKFWKKSQFYPNFSEFWAIFGAKLGKIGENIENGEKWLLLLDSTPQNYPNYIGKGLYLDFAILTPKWGGPPKGRICGSKGGRILRSKYRFPQTFTRDMGAQFFLNYLKVQKPLRNLPSLSTVTECPKCTQLYENIFHFIFTKK